MLRTELESDSSLPSKIAWPFLPLNVPLPAAARRCYPVNIPHSISPGQQMFCVSPTKHPI